MSNWYKTSRYGESEETRGIWYHGTSARFIDSIMSQGLIPNPKKRTWDEDPGSNYNSPSRKSIGGVYITKNIMTAISSSWKTRNGRKEENDLIVVIDFQSRSLIPDEDTLTFYVKEAVQIPYRLSNDYVVGSVYMATVLGGNQSYVDEVKENYIEFVIKSFNYLTKGQINDKLKERLTDILSKNWFTVLERQAAHLYDMYKDIHEWKKYFYNNMPDSVRTHLEEESSKIDQSLSRDEHNKIYSDIVDSTVPVPPSIEEAESRYSAFIDQITRTMKSTIQHQDDFSSKGRSLEPIGFSGSNKIIAIVEYNSYVKGVKVVYGNLPDKFVEDLETRVGPLKLVDKVEYKEPFKNMLEKGASFIQDNIYVTEKRDSNDKIFGYILSKGNNKTFVSVFAKDWEYEKADSYYGLLEELEEKYKKRLADIEKEKEQKRNKEEINIEPEQHDLFDGMWDTSEKDKYRLAYSNGNWYKNAYYNETFNKYKYPSNWSDYSFVLDVVKRDGWALGYASEELRNNPIIVLEAVKKEGMALIYASEKLRNNPEIVLEAVKKRGEALQYVSLELRNNPTIVLVALKQDGMALQYVSLELRNNPTIVLVALKQDGMALQYVSLELRNNPIIVLEAVKKEGMALIYASEKLRNNPEIILEAIKENAYALNYASEELRNNKEIVLVAIRKDGLVLRYASLELRNNTEIVLEAIRENSFALKYASEELRNNPEIVLEATRRNGDALQYASEELRNNPEIVLEAIKENAYALNYASEELRNNKEIVLVAIRKNGLVLRYASLELRNNTEIVLEAVKENGTALQYTSLELRNNTEIVLEAIRENSFSLKYASEELRNNKEFVLEAIKQNTDTLKYISEELRNNPEFIKPLLISDSNFNYSEKTSQYQSLKGKFLDISNKIIQLREELNTSNNKEQTNNEIGKLESQLKKLKQYSLAENVMTEKEIDEILLGNSEDSKTLNKREYLWKKDSGQNFTDADEKVLIVDWSKDLYNEYINDKLINKFISHKPEYSHFSSIFSPLGWALVYEKDDKTWVINQIQSDIVSDFRHILDEVSEEKHHVVSNKVTIDELEIQLNANNRGGYINILQQDRYRNVLISMLNNPNLMFELREAGTEEEALLNISQDQTTMQNLVDQNILSTKGKDTLSDLNIEQLEYIEDKLSWIINGWPNIVFQNVWLQAKENGIENIYMNTSETVSGDLSERARKVFYESFPKSWGFQRVKTNLRGKEEELWYRKAKKNNWYKIAQTEDITPKYLYHSTFASLIHSIKEKGLIPSINPNWGGSLGNSSLGKIYFTDSVENSLYYSTIIFRNKLEQDQIASHPIILRVPFDRANVVHDEEIYYGEELYTEKSISPSDIEFLWQGEWKPISEANEIDEMDYNKSEGHIEDWEGIEFENVDQAVKEVYNSYGFRLNEDHEPSGFNSSSIKKDNWYKLSHTVLSDKSNQKLSVANVGFVEESDDTHLYAAENWLTENDPDFVDGKSFDLDIIDLNKGRDFLEESSNYDIIMVHNIINPDRIDNYVGKSGFFNVSKHHSVENWTNRLSSSGAKYIFLFGSFSEISRSYIGNIPGYTLSNDHWFMHVYKKEESIIDSEINDSMIDKNKELPNVSSGEKNNWYKTAQILEEYDNLQHNVIWLYHGTSEGSFRNIRQNGMTSKTNFFSDSEEYAQSYADRKGNGDRLLRVRKTEDMIPDSDIHYGGDYKTNRTISPEEIEVKVGTDWIPIQEYSDIEHNIMPLSDSVNKTANNVNKTAMGETKFYHIGRPDLQKLSPGQEETTFTDTGDWSNDYYPIWPIFLSVGKPQYWYLSGDEAFSDNEFSLYEIDDSSLDKSKIMADLPSLVDKGMYYEEGIAWWEEGDEPEALKPYLSKSGDIPIRDLLKLWEVTSSITGSVAYIGEVVPTKETQINKKDRIYEEDMTDWGKDDKTESFKQSIINKDDHIAEANKMVSTDNPPIEEKHLNQLSDSDWQQINEMGVSGNFDWRGSEDTKRIFYKLLGRSGKIDQDSYPDHYEFFTSVFGAIPEDGEGFFNVFQEAKKQFSVTNDIYSAGFILPDGSLLDFSGAQEGGTLGTRAYDHRQIHSVIPDSIMEDFLTRHPESKKDRDESFFPMIVFMDLGAIRCNFSNKYLNLDISKPPTPSQYMVIKSAIGSLSDIDIDMSHGGNSIPEKSLSYGSSSFDYSKTRINSTKIVNDIRKFYEGEKESFSESSLTESGRIFSKIIDGWKKIKGD